MDIIAQIKTRLTDMGFEVEHTAYNKLIECGDLNYLKSLPELPAGEPSSLLKYFPHLFAVHKKAKPQKGIFFVVASPLNAEAKDIYERYFPSQIVLVNNDQSNGLHAKWLHTDEQSKPLGVFLQSELN